MADNRRRPTGRGSNKQARNLIRQISLAGGTVTECANGHLRIVGPKGIAIVGPGTKSWRGWRNVITTIRRYAGIEVAMPN